MSATVGYDKGLQEGGWGLVQRGLYVAVRHCSIPAKTGVNVRREAPFLVPAGLQENGLLPITGGAGRLACTGDQESIGNMPFGVNLIVTE